jgi:hypothetical protein
MSKMDRQGVRTPADLERKYNLGSFGKSFAEIIGVSTDAREAVERLESELRSEIREQLTSITRDTERIVMAALESYVESSEFEQLEQTVQSELLVMTDKISMTFETTISEISNTNTDLQSVVETMQKYFDFTADGLTIKDGSGAMSLTLDNGIAYFEVNGQRKSTWNPESFYTGSIYVALNERAQFGNFAFVPRSNGSLDFLKVGE